MKEPIWPSIMKLFQSVPSTHVHVMVRVFNHKEQNNPKYEKNNIINKQSIYSLL